MDNLNTQVYNQENPKKAKTFFSLPKLIFLVLGMILLIEVIYAVRTLNAPVAAPAPQPSQKAIVAQTGGKISLSTPKTNLRISEAVPVSVIVNTGGHEVDGVDLIVHYDPKVLEATPAGLIKGKIFNEYPLLAVDSNKGLISISGVSTKGNFKGAGVFASLNFRAKALGKASLIIDFKKGSTTASNLVEMSSSKNILEEVNFLELNVK